MPPDDLDSARDDFDVTRGAEVTKHGERRVELDDCHLPVAGAQGRLGQQLLRARRFVRSARVSPQVDGGAGGDQRVVGGAGSEADARAAVSCARREEDRSVDSGDVGEPLRRSTRALHVATREECLDHCRQELADQERIPTTGVVDGDPQQRNRFALVSLRESKHRQTGLRILPVA